MNVYQLRFLILSLLLLGLNKVNSQVGIGTTTPKDDAALEVESTTKGFLPPRTTPGAITNPAEGLVIYNTDQKCLNVYVGLGWRNLCVVVGANDVVNPQTGKIWMDRNLGASQVATAFNDTASYGDLYQWGRAAEGHEDRNSNTTTSQATTVVADPDIGQQWYGKFIIGHTDWVNPSANNLWQGINGFNNPCPVGYRLPTEAEWQTEILTWESTADRREDAYNSLLKLPSGGFRRYTDGAIQDANTNGRYWSSTADGTDVKAFAFNGPSYSSNPNDAFMFSSNRGTGRAVRCIKGEE